MLVRVGEFVSWCVCIRERACVREFACVLPDFRFQDDTLRKEKEKIELCLVQKLLTFKWNPSTVHAVSSAEVAVMWGVKW